jgi:uncharacterized protein (DUF1697 family)
MTHRFVALLRGINVGGNNRITMADLRAAFEQLGYTDVVTLLQSGNVVFSAPGPVDSSIVEDGIAVATGVRVRVLVLSAESFRAVALANPLLALGDDPSRLVITFLESPPPAGVPDPDLLAPEVVALTDTAMYQWCPDGVSKSKVPLSYFRALGPAATGRNQRTVEKLLALL